MTFPYNLSISCPPLSFFYFLFPVYKFTFIRTTKEPFKCGHQPPDSWTSTSRTYLYLMHSSLSSSATRLLCRVSSYPCKTPLHEHHPNSREHQNKSSFLLQGQVRLGKHFYKPGGGKRHIDSGVMYINLSGLPASLGGVEITSTKLYSYKQPRHEGRETWRQNQ